MNSELSFKEEIQRDPAHASAQTETSWSSGLALPALPILADRVWVKDGKNLSPDGRSVTLTEVRKRAPVLARQIERELVLSESTNNYPTLFGGSLAFRDEIQDIDNVLLQSQGGSLGFARLLRDLNQRLCLVPERLPLSDYIDGIDDGRKFFKEFFSPVQARALNSPNTLLKLQSHIDFTQFDRLGREAFAAYIRETYPTLDSFKGKKDLRPLCKALGLWPDEKAWQRERGKVPVYVVEAPKKILLRLLELERVLKVKILEREIPNGHTLFNRKGGNLTFYLDKDIVGAQMAAQNTAKALREMFPTLNHVTHNARGAWLMTLLGVAHSGTVKDIAQALVEKGFVSPIMPSNTPIPRYAGSHYFDPAVVNRKTYLNLKSHGEIEVVCDHAHMNLLNYVKENILCLDDIRSNQTLATALGLRTDPNIILIARKLLELRLIDPRSPQGYRPTKRSSGAGHFNQALFRDAGFTMAREIVLDNIKRYLLEHCRTLEDITLETPAIFIVAGALGLTESSLEVAKFAAKERWYSSRIPETQPLMVGVQLTKYLRREVVGDTFVKLNLELWVRENVSNPTDLKLNPSFVALLNDVLKPAKKFGLLAQDKTRIVRALKKVGWVESF